MISPCRPRSNAGSPGSRRSPTPPPLRTPLTLTGTALGLRTEIAPAGANTITFDETSAPDGLSSTSCTQPRRRTISPITTFFRRGVGGWRAAVLLLEGRSGKGATARALEAENIRVDYREGAAVAALEELAAFDAIIFDVPATDVMPARWSVRSYIEDPGGGLS